MMPLPSGWTEVPLRAVCDQRRDFVDVQTDVSYPLLGVHWYGAGAFVRETVTTETSAAKALQPVRSGDLIYNRLFAWKQSFAVVDKTLSGSFVSNEFPLFRVSKHADVRYLLYSLLREDVSAAIDRQSTGATSISRNRWSEENFRVFRVPLPPVEEQRRIADFLDEQVALFDRAVRLEDHARLLCAERLDAVREHLLLHSSDVTWTPLQRLVDQSRPISYGIVQAGPDVADGIPYIKTGDMLNFRPGLLSRTSPEIESAYRRSRVRPGDLVVAMRASIGALIEVPETLPVANLTQGTARIAPRSGIDRDWLHQVLLTRYVQEQFQQRAVGATFRTLNLWDLRRVPIPVPAATHARRLRAQVVQEQDVMDRIADLRQRKASLLTERKQSLITAAVTGQFDVTTARSVA